MNVREQIEVLEKALGELRNLDPDMEVEGHMLHPDGVYDGDLDDPITKILTEVADEYNVVVLHLFF